MMSTDGSIRHLGPHKKGCLKASRQLQGNSESDKSHPDAGFIYLLFFLGGVGVRGELIRLKTI